MTWIIENLQILSTIGSAAAVYLGLRYAAKKDLISVKEDIKEIKNEIVGIKNEIVGIKNEIIGIKERIIKIEMRLDHLDQRVSRIENIIFGRPFFEPKIIEKRDEK